jgi:hypothetical protein
MNITKLYKQLLEGTTSKSYFMKTARLQFPQYISPVTSFDDTVKILKGKRLISESIQYAQVPEFPQAGVNTTLESKGEDFAIALDDAIYAMNLPKEVEDAALLHASDYHLELMADFEYNAEAAAEHIVNQVVTQNEGVSEDIDQDGLYDIITRDGKKIQGVKFFANGEWYKDSNGGRRIGGKLPVGAKVVKSGDLTQNEGVSGDEHDEALMNIVLKYVKDPDIAMKYILKGFPDWLDDNLAGDEEYQDYLKTKEEVKEGGDPTRTKIDQSELHFLKKLYKLTPTEKIANKIKDLELKLAGQETPLQEAHQLTTDQILDRLNPYSVKKGIEAELAKKKVIDDTTYSKVKEIVAKKLKSNPKAYDELVVSNAKEIEKKDAKLETVEVKDGNHKDDKNKAKVIAQNPKASSKASTKENRKGKPKGVKEMSSSVKKAKGITKVLPQTGKEKVIKELKEALMESEGAITPPPHEYRVGNTVATPEGEGIVTGVVGGTLTIKLPNGEKDFQINVINKAERDKKFGSMKGFGSALQNPMEEETASHYGTLSPEEKAKIKSKLPDAEFEYEEDDDTSYTAVTSNASSESEILKAIKAAIAKNPELKELFKNMIEAKKFNAGGEVIFKSDAEAPGFEQDLRKKGVKFTKTQA